jgi:hypothetical protein
MPPAKCAQHDGFVAYMPDLTQDGTKVINGGNSSPNRVLYSALVFTEALFKPFA